MSPALIAASLWAIAGTIVAFLPMRLQYVPGVALLIAAPVLLVWIGVSHGLGAALICTLAVLSLFRRPLVYFWRRARGESPEVPK